MGKIVLLVVAIGLWGFTSASASTEIPPIVEVYASDYIGQQGTIEDGDVVFPARWFWSCEYADEDGGGPRSNMYWEVLGPYGYLDYMATVNHEMAYPSTRQKDGLREVTYFKGYQETWKPGLYEFTCAINQDGLLTVSETLHFEVVAP